jgi:large subunit ribosomal protein L25
MLCTFPIKTLHWHDLLTKLRRNNMTGITITAKTRAKTGTSHVRRLRRIEHMTPAVVYGAGLDTQLIMVDQKSLNQTLAMENIHTQVLQLVIDDQAPVDVMLKRCQRHASRATYIHIDFLRIKAREKISVKVPVHCVGEEQCQAVKDGGVVQHLIKEIEVHSTPAKLPTHIDINISTLALDQTLHLSDITLESGVELTSLTAEPPRDDAIITIHRPKLVSEEDNAEGITSDSTGAEGNASSE